MSEPNSDSEDCKIGSDEHKDVVKLSAELEAAWKDGQWKRNRCHESLYCVDLLVCYCCTKRLGGETDIPAYYAHSLNKLQIHMNVVCVSNIHTYQIKYTHISKPRVIHTIVHSWQEGRRPGVAHREVSGEGVARSSLRQLLRWWLIHCIENVQGRQRQWEVKLRLALLDRPLLVSGTIFCDPISVCLLFFSVTREYRYWCIYIVNAVVW